MFNKFYPAVYKKKAEELKTMGTKIDRRAPIPKRRMEKASSVISLSLGQFVNSSLKKNLVSAPSIEIES